MASTSLVENIYAMCNKLVINSQVKSENGCFNYAKSKIIKNSQKNTRRRKFQEVEVGDLRAPHNRGKLAVLHRHPHHTQVQKLLRENSSCLSLYSHQLLRKMTGKSDGLLHAFRMCRSEPHSWAQSCMSGNPSTLRIDPSQRAAP